MVHLGVLLPFDTYSTLFSKNTAPRKCATGGGGGEGEGEKKEAVV